MPDDDKREPAQGRPIKIDVKESEFTASDDGKREALTEAERIREARGGQS